MEKEIRVLREQGLTKGEIASRLGVTLYVIKKVLERKEGHCTQCGKLLDTHAPRRFCSNQCCQDFRFAERVDLTRQTGVVQAGCRNSGPARRIMKEIKEYVCEVCGQDPVWQGKELTLTLDHIDGDVTNNRVENLRWLCPNCDTQTLTYCSKNKGKGRPWRYPKSTSED